MSTVFSLCCFFEQIHGDGDGVKQENVDLRPDGHCDMRNT